MKATLVRAIRLLSAVVLVAIVEGASAQAPVKIGLIGEFTGPFADYGTQIYNGIKAYLKQNGDVFGGRKVEFIVKDTTGAVPDRAKRLALDAITQDGVEILAGFGLTPNALATAPVATEAKKPMVIMNAATSVITHKPWISSLPSASIILVA